MRPGPRGGRAVSWRAQQCLSSALGTSGQKAERGGQWAWRDPASCPQAGWTLSAAAAAPWPGTSLGLGGWGLPVQPWAHGLCPIRSRAVQRSLAIVRQARQKKRRKKEEYCMYYNRFGRCKRGEGCPYIHDPEKVAVCTRCPQPFWASQVGWRGVCVKPCPWSHWPPRTLFPIRIGLFGAHARRQTGPVPSPTTSPRRR